MHRDPLRYPVVRVIAEPAAPLLDIVTLRRQCSVVVDEIDSDGIETAQDDPILLDCLDAAVQAAEDFTGRSIAIRTLEMAVDGFPTCSAWGYPRGGIELLRPPVISIEAVYAGSESDLLLVEGGDVLDSDGVIVEYGYSLDPFDPPVIYPASSWPTVVAEAGLVRIRYRAGYSAEGDPDSDAQPLPAGIKRAILLLVGHYYRTRESAQDKPLVDVPNGFEVLLRPYRLKLGLA